MTRPPMSKRRRIAVLVHDGRRCVVCGARNRLTVHHLKPRALGGPDDVRNVVTLCEGCHTGIERSVHRVVHLVCAPLLVLARLLRPLRWPA